MKNSEEQNENSSETVKSNTEKYRSGFVSVV